jgi:hypothetical protein
VEPDIPNPQRQGSLFYWFLAFGVLGLAVALFLLYALSHELVVADYAIIFWPTSMVLLAANDSYWTKVLTIGFAFGGNFILYGLIGIIVGFFVNRFRRPSVKP